MFERSDDYCGCNGQPYFTVTVLPLRAHNKPRPPMISLFILHLI
jgi:hypothetical protein